MLAVQIRYYLKTYFMQLNSNFLQYLLKLLPITHSSIVEDQLFITIQSSKILSVLAFLKYHTNCQYKILTDLCVIDYPANKNRFSLIYNLLSITFNSRLKVTIQINEFQQIPSISNIFINSNWYEREAWDLFGIYFLNHPDLRRILTDYGFEGHPLRKDFPLTGFIEVRYNETKKRIVYEPILLAQKYRTFNFESPWT